MKRVIVTGVSGFLGRHTVAHLLNYGYEIHSVARGVLPPDLKSIQEKYPACFQHTSFDLLDTRTAEQYVRNVKASHLLHLAWDTRHGLFWTSLENKRWVESSRAIINAFIASGGSRLVVAGTCAEYEWGERPLCEYNSPLRPTTLYGQSKLLLREFIQQHVITTGVSCSWGRIFHLFGPFEYAERLVASACSSLVRGEYFKATHGSQIRDFASTLDMAEGLVALLESDITGDVNIASGESWSIASILQKLGALASRPELIQLGAICSAPNDPPSITADTSRLADEVKFSPRQPVAERLAETLEWWSTKGSRC